MDVALIIGIAIAVVLVVVLALYFWASYRSLLTLRQRVDEAWRDIIVQLQRRAELIPTLVDAVQGYAAHERAVFDAVQKARAETVEAVDPVQATAAENDMQRALRSIFAVAENYPKLHSSTGFLQLQADIVDTAEKIQASRRFYNGGVREFNTKIAVFPNTLFAKRVGGGQRQFFDVADSAAIAEPPRVQF